MNENTLTLVIILLSCFFLLIALKKYNQKIQKLVYQKTDNDIHLVADLPTKKESAILLEEIKRKLMHLVDYCIKKYPDNPDVKILKRRFDPTNIQETSSSDPGTSYTIDKGSEVHLCLRDKKTLRLHNINILIFVAIHELAHIMSSSYGHNNEFSKNFVFLLEKAVECGIYVPENYAQNSKQFCGIIVNSNPLFSSF